MEPVLVAPVPNFGLAADNHIVGYVDECMVVICCIRAHGLYGHSHRGIRGGKRLCGDEDPIYGVRYGYYVHTAETIGPTVFVHA